MSAGDARGRKDPREAESPAVGKALRAVITASMGTSPASGVARQVAPGSGETRAEVPSRQIPSVDVSGSALVASAARAASISAGRRGGADDVEQRALQERRR